MARKQRMVEKSYLHLLVLAPCWTNWCSMLKKHHMDNVVFIPYQDKADLIYSLNAGDVHWCVNAKGIKGVSCRSNITVWLLLLGR